MINPCHFFIKIFQFPVSSPLSLLLASIGFLHQNLQGEIINPCLEYASRATSDFSEKPTLFLLEVGTDGIEVYFSRPSFQLSHQRVDLSLYLARTCCSKPKIAALRRDIGTRDWGQTINRKTRQNSHHLPHRGFCPYSFYLDSNH